MKKNLFQNGDFKDAMRDWSLQTVSTLDSNNWVTGTLSAGAAGFTQSSSTTAEALEGRTSGKWAKAAANYQRQGFQSEVLQVDKELQGNVAKFEFSYNLTQVSGTLSLTGVVTTHDIKIAIYDITNSAWIQPSGHLAINSIGIAAIATGEFQLPINTAQVKMFIYQATTSTAAWSIVLDSFFIGKNGSPTINGSLSSRATNNAATVIATSGDTLIPYLLTSGSYFDDFGSWDSSIFTVKIPGKYRISAKIRLADGQSFTTNDYIALLAKIDNTTYYGLGSYSTQTTASVAYGAFIVGVVELNLLAGQTIRIVANSVLAATKTILGSNPNYSSCEISFASGASAGASTSVVAASAQGTGTNAMTTGTLYILAMTTSNFDTHGAQTVSAATNGTTTKSGWYYTCPSQGYYQVTSQISTNGSNIAANSYVAVSLRKNGSNQASMGIVPGGNNPQYSSINGTQIVFCNAGDYLELAFETSLSTITLANNQGSSVNVMKVQGPATIASGDTVSARYRTAAGQTITAGSVQIVDFGIKDWDYRSNVTTGVSWKFKASEPGVYLVKSGVFFNYIATSIVSAEASVYLLKNGSAFSMLGSRIYDVTNNSAAQAGGSDEVRLLAGDYIQIGVYQNNGISVPLSANGTLNWVSITRIGNY